MKLRRVLITIAALFWLWFLMTAMLDTFGLYDIGSGPL